MIARCWRQKPRCPCIKLPNESLERFCLHLLCVKLIASIKDILLNERIKAEKHLRSNKYMRTEDVMCDFLKRKKGRAFGFLKIACKE